MQCNRASAGLVAFCLPLLLSMGAAQAQVSDGVMKIGVLADMSGAYSDLGGPGAVLATQMAIDDFVPQEKPAFKIEMVYDEHENKGDISGQTSDGDWERCNDSDPDLSIRGCNAVIESGRETTENLARAFNNRGNAYNHKREYDRAIQDYDQALRLQPQYAEPFNGRGAAYNDKRDYDRAILDYDEAIRLKPDYAHAFYDRGNAYRGKHDYDRAIQDYDQAIKLKPDDADAFSVRCMARAIADKGLETALADCNESLRLRAEDAFTLRARGFVYFRTARYDKAIADCSASLEINPKFASSLYVRGVAERRMGHVKSGDADIAAAKAIDSTIDKTYGDFGVKP